MIEWGFGCIINVSFSYGSFVEGLKGLMCYVIIKVVINVFMVKMVVVVDEVVDGKFFDVIVNSMILGWVYIRMGGSDVFKMFEEGVDMVIWLVIMEEGGFYG